MPLHKVNLTEEEQEAGTAKCDEMVSVGQQILLGEPAMGDGKPPTQRLPDVAREPWCNQRRVLSVDVRLIERALDQQIWHFMAGLLTRNAPWLVVPRRIKKPPWATTDMSQRVRGVTRSLLVYQIAWSQTGDFLGTKPTAH